jgi:hypothetical protein
MVYGVEMESNLPILNARGFKVGTSPKKSPYQRTSHAFARFFDVFMCIEARKDTDNFHGRAA